MSLTDGETDDILDEERAGRYRQKPNGQMNGSDPDPRTVALPHGKTGRKEHDPDEYSNLTVGSRDNTRRTEVDKFEGKGKQQKHIKKHMENVGARSEREYEAMAVEFLSKPLGANMEELILPDGKKLRYDYSTNEFGVTNPRGNASSYFKPEEGTIFREKEVIKNGKKK